LRSAGFQVAGNEGKNFGSDEEIDW